MVVCAGLTGTDPFSGTVPIPEIEALVPFCVVQVRVELCPGAIVVGFAVNVAIVGAAGAAATVTVTVCVAVVPPAPVTVSV